MICRICSGHDLGDVIDLGMMPLVNRLLDHPDDEALSWPLKVVYCRRCTAVQLTETPPPDLSFADYPYFSSQSRTMVDHARNLVGQYVRPGQRCLEIASNDGYLLQFAKAAGADVLGIDPAANIVKDAISKGISTICAYFSPDLADVLISDWGMADVVFANNVLAHVPDPHSFMSGIKRILSPEGTAHIEVPYLGDLIETGAFDTIYHEHQFYFSVTSLANLAHEHDLRIVNVQHIAIHGGSLHITIRHEGDESALAGWLEHERERGMFVDEYYASFRKRVSNVIARFTQAVESFDQIAGYAAAAKAVIMLNACGITVDRLPWIADISRHKQGKYLPGTRQRILAPDALLQQRPDAAAIFAWNIKDEVVRDNSQYLACGGRFIVPLPELSIVN